MRRHRDDNPDNRPHIMGITADVVPSADDILREAMRERERLQKLYLQAQNQKICFTRGPVALAYAADLHIGSRGTDYKRMWQDARTIAATPNMWLILGGDLVDNFIVPKLMAARHSAKVTIEEEWLLVEEYLNLVAPRLLVSVRGNHENWTYTLSAIDYFRDVLKRAQPKALYDTDDARFTVRVGKAEFPCRVRHHWRGYSLWNATQGIERLAHQDNDFKIGFGAHVHSGGLAREFVVNGQSGLAVMCGTYKSIDPFARAKGFRQSNRSTVACVILGERGTMFGVSDLDEAARIMRALARRG